MRLSFCEGKDSETQAHGSGLGTCSYARDARSQRRGSRAAALRAPPAWPPPPPPPPPPPANLHAGRDIQHHTKAEPMLGANLVVEKIVEAPHRALLSKGVALHVAFVAAAGKAVPASGRQCSRQGRRCSCGRRCAQRSGRVGITVRQQHRSTHVWCSAASRPHSLHMHCSAHLYTSHSLRLIASSILDHRQSSSGSSPNPGVVSHTCAAAAGAQEGQGGGRRAGRGRGGRSANRGRATAAGMARGFSGDPSRR